MSLDGKQFNFLSILTGVVVLAYLTAWGYALVSGKSDITAFVRDVGPTVTLLIGYWARGVQ